MTFFVLVHGSNHGPWCWSHLTPYLTALGHECVAVDLPCEDPTAGLAVYAEIVADAVGDRGADTILVGHSLAGLSIPIAATKKRVRSLVYLCPAIPALGRSFFDQLLDLDASGHTLITPVVHEDGTLSLPVEAAMDVFFHDCTPDDQAWAIAQLRRQASLPNVEPTPLERFPDVASSVILGRDDRVFPAEWVRTAARERLGVTPIELDGGHSPFLARPELLSQELHKLASL